MRISFCKLLEEICRLAKPFVNEKNVFQKFWNAYALYSHFLDDHTFISERFIPNSW